MALDGAKSSTKNYRRLPLQPPRILDVLHRHRLVPVQPDRQQVEPIAISPPPVPNPPAFRGPGQSPALLPPHRLERRAARPRATGLHLHECDQEAAPSDEIHVVAAEPEAVRLDGPAAGGEVRERHPFTPQPSKLAGMGPFPYGNEGALQAGRRGHGPKIGGRRVRTVIPPPRPGAEKAEARAPGLCVVAVPAHPSSWPRRADPGCSRSSDGWRDS
jgi:hypothetical protein